MVDHNLRGQILDLLFRKHGLYLSNSDPQVDGGTSGREKLWPLSEEGPRRFANVTNTNHNQ